MQILIKRSGRFAEEDPGAPQVRVIEGETIDGDALTEHVRGMILRGGYGEEVDGEERHTGKPVEAVKPPVVQLTLREKLSKIASTSRSKSAAKDALEKYGKDNYGIDVDRRQSVANIMEAIIEAADEAGG